MKRAICLTSVLAVLLLAGCEIPKESEESEAEQTGSFVNTRGDVIDVGEEAQAQREEFDPPQAFDVENPVVLPDTRFLRSRLDEEGPVLDGVNLYATDKPYGSSPDALKAYDTDAGELLFSLSEKQLGAEKLSDPFIAEVQGKKRVILSAQSVEEGVGTQRDTYFAHFFVISTRDGEVLEKFTSEFEYRNNENLKYKEHSLLGAGEDVAIVSVSYKDSKKELRGISLTSGKTLWVKEEFEYKALHNGTVFGMRDAGVGNGDLLYAYDALSGEESWRAPAEHKRQVFMDVTDTSVFLHYFTSDDGQVNHILSLDRKTGKQKQTLPLQGVIVGTAGFQADCHTASSPLIVCTWSHTLVALDMDKGEEIWSIVENESARDVPDLEKVRGKHLYVEADSEPVVISAETGKDVEAEPGLIPEIFNGYVGVAVCQSSKIVDLCAYPALR